MYVTAILRIYPGLFVQVERLLSRPLFFLLYVVREKQGGMDRQTDRQVDTRLTLIYIYIYIYENQDVSHYTAR
jgi:hypothetical protein